MKCKISFYYPIRKLFNKSSYLFAIALMALMIAPSHSSNIDDEQTPHKIGVEALRCKKHRTATLA